MTSLVLNVVWLVAFLCCLASCSPDYVIRAAYEEGKILWRRQPIATVLQREDLDPAVRKKLTTVLEIREFAKNELDLRVGGSYTSYSYVDGPVLAHLLTAVPKTEFQAHTWWFLFVGSVPYKGYFDRDDAESEARELEQNGHDTHIRPVGAFSTLGWFDDPLLEHLLRLNEVRLADVIIHELFHNTLFVSGSVEFNEALANFVGKRAAIKYFVARDGFASPEARMARQNWADEREFSRFVMKWVRCLKELYGQELAGPEKLRRRTELFEAMQAAWREQIAGRDDHLHGRFGDVELNNAVLMQDYLYVNNLELFEMLYERTGRNLRSLIERVREATEMEVLPYESLAQLVGRADAETPQSLCTTGTSNSVTDAP